ncbi:MAG: TPR end-of-group domain-containing protein [Archangium sp.]
MKLQLAALALISTVASAAPTPVLTGLYSVGELGILEFSTIDGKVVGKVRSVAQCPFAPEAVVVQGTLEGTTFTGTVVLCQDDTPNCSAMRTYPMLGVFHDESVAGYVRLENGCTSPALDRGQLHLKPASYDEKQKVMGGSSASAHAQKNSKVDAAQLAAEALSEGNRYLQDQKVGQARDRFRAAMELDENRWEAFMGYGVTEVKLDHATLALPYFEKSLALAQRLRATSGQIAQIHYNRACALVALNQQPEAVAALRTAVKLGGAATFVDSFQADPDLEPLRTNVDFKRLSAEVLVQARRKK